MSRHQYIRNLDYQDAIDEFEGYAEEEDELSPDDRALMTAGTIDVQAALGVEVSKVTVAQIEEALWHYYFDVDKSVTYLTTKFINPQPKETKPAAKQPHGKSAISATFPAELDTPTYWARGDLDMTDTGSLVSQDHFRPSLTPRQGLEHSSHFGSPLTTRPFQSRTSLAHLFRDMPWGNVPKHRETTFIPPPMARLGLLGGSGAAPKISKLQALAAARKKKAEEKGATQDKMESARTKMNELSVGDAPVATEVPLAGAFSKRLKTSESTAQGRVPLVISEPTRSEPSQSSSALVREPEVMPSVDKAPQSMFAQTLFGSHADVFNRMPQESYSLYADLPPSVLDAFTKPSPDDVVLAAQAKGSLTVKSKR